jgi:signal transduction histidine kinase
VLFTLAPQIKATPYNIAIDCPNELIVVSKPGPINQILINLVLNSIIHGFEKRDFGTINIHVMKLGEQLNILYHDDGHGIDDCIKHKIFEPFTTTKRGEGGSGLGLHLVYNLVTQALGGTISLIDTAAGANFEINFPINEYSI